MNICMLAPEFFPIWGGVGTYTIELIRHLSKKVNVHIVAPWREIRRHDGQHISTSDYDLSTFLGDNVTLHLISNASDNFFYNAKFQYACFKYVPNLVKDEKIDIIHSHTAQMPDILLQFRKIRVPILTTVHTTIRGQRQGTISSRLSFSELDTSEKMTLISYPFLRIIEDTYFSGKRYYIVISKWLKKQLMKQYPRRDFSSITVIPNSIDLTDFPSRKTKIYGENENEMVLLTGRMTAAKGIYDLIRAMPLVIREYPKVRFIFIGPGDIEPYIKILKKNYITENNYSFLGYLARRTDLIKYYSSCAVYVVPTLYETFGIRILEAMACECPVIASNICGIPEIIENGRDGLLIKPRSKEELAVAICRLLSDPTLRVKLGKNARNTVKSKFSYEVNAGKTYHLYEKIIEKSDI